MFAATAIVTFFSQVMPSIASEGLRTWLLVRLGRNWRLAVASVMIDRAIGVGSLAIVSFLTLLLPSALAAALQQRNLFVEIFGAILAVSAACLAATPYLAPLLERCPYTAWAGSLAHATYFVMLRSAAGLWSVGSSVAIDLLAVTSVWLLSRSLGLTLSIADCAVLFTVIFGAALIPISIAGWGIRELAVTALLNSAGFPLEEALVFSVCFGLTLLVAALPGAVIWLLYSPSRPYDAVIAADRP